MQVSWFMILKQFPTARRRGERLDTWPICVSGICKWVWQSYLQRYCGHSVIHGEHSAKLDEKTYKGRTQTSADSQLKFTRKTLRCFHCVSIPTSPDHHTSAVHSVMQAFIADMHTTNFKVCETNPAATLNECRIKQEQHMECCWNIM